jgi:uncharacterized protein Usg
MKSKIATITVFFTSFITSGVFAQQTGQQLFVDVHELNSKVKFEDVAAAHQKDLATQSKYGVSFIKYWVDESKGLVYCLSSAKDSSNVVQTHKEAHGLLPAHVWGVTEGQAAALKDGKNLFLDIHYLGAGNVTAKDVVEAHKKDLAVQSKYKVNFINYWVNEKDGVVLCLSQASDTSDVINTHKEAHGLLPAVILTVKQGQ